MSKAITASRARFASVPAFNSIGIRPPAGRSHACKHRSGNSRRAVHFFLDMSNIMIGAKTVAASKGEGPLRCSDIRVHFENLRHFVQQDRVWGSGYAAAGLHRGEGVKAQAESSGIQFDVCELGCRTNTEQGVDEKIIAKMAYMMFRQAAPNPPTPGVIVLATGDGNGHLEGAGFLPVLKAFHHLGFEIEVLSWRHSLNTALGEWAAQHGQLIELDSWYEELTYIEYGRQAKTVNELYRKLAQQRPV